MYTKIYSEEDRAHRFLFSIFRRGNTSIVWGMFSCSLSLKSIYKNRAGNIFFLLTGWVQCNTERQILPIEECATERKVCIALSLPTLIHLSRADHPPSHLPPSMLLLKMLGLQQYLVSVIENFGHQEHWQGGTCWRLGLGSSAYLF